jgi:MFS family permease
MQMHVLCPVMTSPHSPAAAHWDGRLWAVLIVLCGVLFLDGLDVSMVGVALPSIQADLGLTNSELQWIVSGYVLGYGGFLLLGGRVADLLGRKRTLIAALAVFTVASALGALVDDGTVLVITRFIKGMAAAFTAPAGLSIITTTFAEGPARNKALTIYTATGASGFSLGLVFGGLLTEIGWRWTFLLPVPVALALLIAAPRVIRADRPQLGARRRFDIPGAVTVTAAMLVLVRTVVEAPAEGWSSLATVLGFALAAALLAAFVTIEHRTAQPLLRLSILKSGRLVRANLAGLALFGAYFGFQFVGTLYLQGMLGWSPVETALAFLPAGLLVAVGATRMGPVIDRVGTEKVIATGLAASVIGYVLFLRMDADPSYAGTILPTILLLGIGFALIYPAVNIQATSGIGDSEQGLASGLVNTAFQVGGALGLAIITAVVSAQAGDATDATSLLDGYRPAVAVSAGIALLGLLATLPGIIPARRDREALDAA